MLAKQKHLLKRSCHKNKIAQVYLSFTEIKIYVDRCLVSLVDKVPVYRAGGSGSISGQTNTQGLKIIEKKVLPLP